MWSTGVALLTAFSSGLLASQVLHRAPTCACDCSPSSEGEAVLDLLRSQLERCGPEQLTIPTEKLHKAEAAAAEASLEATAVAAEVRFSRNLLLGTLGGATIAAAWSLSRRPARPLALAGGTAGANLALENVPRWTPPAGNRARRL